MERKGGVLSIGLATRPKSPRSQVKKAGVGAFFIQRDGMGEEESDRFNFAISTPSMVRGT